MRAWLLPENIEDVLPAKAWRMEEIRRAMLDLFRLRGYELVIPPLIEFVDSLLTGTGSDLDLKTFKLVDQHSGRLMGVRADITPQVARIDAHLLGNNPVNRLCYVGSVLHAKPDGVYHSREPIQLGAELFGMSGTEADVEILRLMLAALNAIGLNQVQLDIGHVGIYRALATEAELTGDAEQSMFEALQSKAGDQVEILAKGLRPHVRDALMALTDLYGDAGILAEASRCLPPLPDIGLALDTLETLAKELAGEGVDMAFDLAELRGYGYHSGVVFAAYAGGRSRAVALGGRYDEIGKVFGRARSATGFSLELRELIELIPA
ncbi:MAG: ATP phosphoribosyltransferase regulatory subunit [Hydrogenophilaceae bacterium]|nr:ATP phosphoribosyltransferase regulatory subunit [Hydrogenophilaceae bacterium]